MRLFYLFSVLCFFFNRFSLAASVVAILFMVPAERWWNGECPHQTDIMHIDYYSVDGGDCEGFCFLCAGTRERADIGPR